MPLHPTAHQIDELAGSPLAGPVVMLNLLRFDGQAGQDSYRSYGEAIGPLLARVGGRLLWHARADSVVIGDPQTDGWDAVILVEYPSRKAFLEMASSPEYPEVGLLRDAALKDSRLIACTELVQAFG